MTDFDLWLSNASNLTTPTTTKAVQAWLRINDKSESVVLIRNRSALTPQLFRIEPYATGTIEQGVAAKTAIRQIAVFGVRDHPDATVIDSDIKPGDRFVIDKVEYQVLDVAELPGEVQARCQALS